MRAHILLNGTIVHGAAAARRGVRALRRRSLPLGRSALLAAALAAAGALAQTGEQGWRDLESRIQYGYYTEDAAALRKLSDTLPAAAERDKLGHYYAALLGWRMALLAAEGGAAARAAPGGSSAKLAQRCVSELDAALELDADFAEALALRAACLDTPQETAGGYAPLASHRARKDLERALQLIPHGPRALLVDAMGDYQLPAAHGGNKERALGKLRQAVAAFEAERAALEPVPGWGAAEAWLLLARDLLDHGEAVAARDALEHALLIAPEYAQARRLMARLTSG